MAAADRVPMLSCLVMKKECSWYPCMYKPAITVAKCLLLIIIVCRFVGLVSYSKPASTFAEAGTTGYSCNSCWKVVHVV